jgi:Flp pilus assembly protein CpaB
MTYRVRNILIAVALAVVAGLLTLFYVTSYKKHVDSQQKSVAVLVAKKDIPAGTLGSQVVSGHMLVTAHVSRKAVVPGLITSPKQISRLIATQAIYQGEQVTSRRFGPVVEAGIRTQLKGTFRAVQLAGDPNQLLAGTLHPGDHVDVVGVLEVDNGNGSDKLTFARVVIRDVLVLRTSGGSDAAKVTSPGGGNNSVILRVTDNQSQKLAMVYKKGAYWAVELRPSLGDADSPASVETPWTLLTDGISTERIRQAVGGGR